MSSMFGGGFKASKCKTLLRLAMARIKLLRNKRDIQVKQMRKDISQLLQTGQEPSARIRVEHIAREQNIMAAYDILELFCELLTVRLSIIEAQKQCPLDLKEAVSSLIFAAPRCADLPELVQIRNLFTAKYGKEFVAAAAELRPDCGVNRRIIEKLSVRAPPGETKLKLLKEIAEEYKVEWDPADTEAELMKRHEDLLDGPKEFFGASSAPVSEGSQSSPSVNQSSSFSRRAQDAAVHPPPQPPPPPPSAPSASAAIQMMPLDPSSDEDTSPETKPQFVPFLGPHPSQRVRAESTTVPSRASNTNTSSTSGKYDSQKATSRSDSYSTAAKKEGHKNDEETGDYLNVDDAVQAAAEYSRRAAAAARAAAALRKSQSLSPSPPPSRRGTALSSNVDDSDEEEDSDDEPLPRGPHERRRPAATRYTEETPKHEPKRNESGRSRNDGALFTRRNVEEEKEFSFRTNIQPDPKQSSVPKRSNSGDRDDASFRGINSNERQEGSNRRGNSGDRDDVSFRGINSNERHEGSNRRRNSGDRDDASFRRVNSNERQEGSDRRTKSEELKETTARDEVHIRRNSSGNRVVFSNYDDDQQECTFWKRGSESRAEYDVEPPRRVDPENETFWKPADPDWRSGEYNDISKKIDSGIFTGDAEEDTDHMRKSSVSRRNDHGRYGDGSYSDASKIFSRADSAESDLFKRSDSAELDVRSSDEFYDSKQGFVTPKFDDEDHSSAVGNSRLSTRYEDDSSRRNSSSTKSSKNDFWRADSRSQGISPEEEAFVRKYSFSGREDLKPLDKAKSDTLSEKYSHTAASSESIERAGSDPLYSRSFTTDESRLHKQESSVPTKSRRTRINREKPEDLGSFGSPVRRSKTYSYEDSPTAFDDSPHTSRPIPFKPSPSSNSSSYQSPEAQHESPPSTLTHSASVHPKLPDIDDLTARFEALKAAKR